MTPEKCPGCGCALRPEMSACPNCPMSFPDDAPASFENPLKQSPYYRFLTPALFLLGAGAAVWYLGVGLMNLGSAEKPVSPAISEPAPGTEGSPLPAPRPPADGGGTVSVAPVPEEASAPPPPAARRDPPPAAPVEWKLRGAVYDLATLQPLPDCSILFTDAETGRTIRTRTDAAGRYRAIVPPLGGGRGYGVGIEKSGYAPNYLDPAAAGVRAASASRRAELARGLAETLAAAPATVRAESAAPRLTDFYLAPRPTAP